MIYFLFIYVSLNCSVFESVKSVSLTVLCACESQVNSSSDSDYINFDFLHLELSEEPKHSTCRCHAGTTTY